MKTKQLLIAATVMAVAISAMAWPGEEPPPPPPPPPQNACSPGFWKNHTELWVGLACTGGMCDAWLADLQARGPGSSVVRGEVTNYLNAWADGYYQKVVCTNE